MMQYSYGYYERHKKPWGCDCEDCRSKGGYFRRRVYLDLDFKRCPPQKSWIDKGKLKARGRGYYSRLREEDL